MGGPQEREFLKGSHVLGEGPWGRAVGLVRRRAFGYSLGVVGSKLRKFKHAALLVAGLLACFAGVLRPDHFRSAAMVEHNLHSYRVVRHDFQAPSPHEHARRPLVATISHPALAFADTRSACRLRQFGRRGSADSDSVRALVKSKYRAKVSSTEGDDPDSSLPV